MEANIKCPSCGAAMVVPFSAMAPGAGCSCTSCGQTVKFSGQDASKLQQAIDQLASQVGGANVKVTVKTKTARPWWKFWGS